ncbi:MAG: methyltransferase domain-containing protein, partial [Actinomycetota bacterium]
MTDGLAAVDGHYSRPDLSTVLLDALRAAGLDPGALRPDDLTPFEEFHTGGRPETADLAEKAGIGPGMRVLDVGCGLGGPARFLARTYGCTVTGVDAATEFVTAGTMLTERVGQAGAVTILRADALDLPFPDASFDAAWTQHVSMNIADKAAFYRSIRRVLRPGGRLAFHDFVAGDGRPIHFPVPWAESEDLSFLATADETRDLPSSRFLSMLPSFSRTPGTYRWRPSEGPAGGGRPWVMRRNAMPSAERSAHAISANPAPRSRSR